MESQIDDRTSCIVVNNPSNPCGSVFSRKHLEEIVAVSEKHKVPILADEVYDRLVHDEESEFISLAEIATDVPLIRANALSKAFCVPGWRLGWILVHNKHGYFDDVLANLNKMSMLNMHPSSLA